MRVGKPSRSCQAARSRGSRRLLALGAVATTAVLVLAGCSKSVGSQAQSSAIGAHTSGTASSSAPASSAAVHPVAAAAVITTSPDDGAKAFNPARPVSVDIRNGKLTTVTMTNPAGKHVTGTLASDGSSWATNEALGYAKTYQIVARGVDASGAAVTKRARLTTLNPDVMTMPSLERMGGYALTNNATYGVGIVPVVHFDEVIDNEAAAQRALTITTSPALSGSWSWIDNQNVAWRPQHFWPSGTKVTVAANVYGVKVGQGLYGESDVQTSFRIGVQQITYAYDNVPKVNKVKVYRNGTLVRTMNTSMGMHSGEQVNGQYIDFHTMKGTYTVLEHDNPAMMSSASYGLPANAPGGYAPEPIYYSTKISTDGIYLHELDNTTWAQDNGYDVSHGCLNLDHDNAVWFYTHSQIGDPVIISGTGGPTIQPYQGGDWSVPWSTWLKGSAL